MLEKSSLTKEFLLAPIVVDRNYKGYTFKDGIITSGQTYIRETDADMSDVAIDFYELVYNGFIPGDKLLNSKGGLMNTDFAGDTINSFKTIANREGTGAGKSDSQRTPECKWEAYLVNYNKRYHCLANFWLIPLELGRTGKKGSKMQAAKDYEDRFLHLINEHFNDYKKSYPDYFKNINKLEEFFEKNILVGSYVQENKIIDFSSTKLYSPKDVIDSMMNMMEKRAEEIVLKFNP